MKWTKLKHLVEQRIAPSIRSRFAINSAAYGACSCGHAWITLDKKVVANFCTRAFWNIPRKFDDSTKKWVSKDQELTNGISSNNDNDLTNYGELSRQDAYQACWEFVHDLSIEEALSSEDPLVQSLAVIDSRVGKRTLKTIDVDTLHPLAGKLFTERCRAEHLKPKLNNYK
ncbi:hypothetical protein RI845_16010 [Thalassotalea nanhaiensis]|uniref:Uncharacterized protein n=1 Tax=Thalassotalea nanhaiensis TaxID=3065648 RepID=A0ABY9THW0_9GAMM|nr:hypothetical protein RI845_16010 [Colwelliaceae bacterium SQ345]